MKPKMSNKFLIFLIFYLLYLKMDSNCAICGEQVTEDKHYFSKHKIKIADYFQKYHPRYDKFTNELIPFKSKDSYFLSDFINKNNLRAWFKQVSLKESQTFCRELLIKRKELKNLKFAPSQIELRSIIAPSVIFYDKIFPQGYQELCSEIGLANRFNAFNKVIKEPVINTKKRLIIDSREQKSLKLDIPIEIKKLEYGDYYLPDNKFNIFVERKSLNDFLGTLGRDYDRFCREIERAQKNGSYLIVLIEEDINNALSFNHLPWVNRHTKATPDYIFHNVRQILQTYSNLQFLFVKGRKEASVMIKKIFFSEDDFRMFDNQLAYDCHII